MVTVNKEIKFKKIKVFSLALAGLPMFMATPAYATVPTISGDILIDGLISTLIYAIIGILMAVLSFKVMDSLTPGDLKHQLTEEKNVALGVMVGLQALGISIIIAAAIAG